jgi:heterodisulfide reductase subunit C
MKEFGFTLHHDSTIDLDGIDKSVQAAISSLEPSVNQCIGCGCCTATCSAGQYTGFNIRMLHTLLRRGEMKNVRKEISKCMFCGKCQLVCPRGVNLRNLILTIHQIIEIRNG